MKVVAGTPLRRPAWFFDIDEYGEGLADVGTHVVDLVQWTAFPDRLLDYRKDIEILGGRRWPLKMTREQFTKVTGSADFPAALAGHVHDGVLDYYCNNSVAYTLRGIHVELEILWNWEAAEGGDVYEASFRGTKSRVEIRQGKAERFIPEVYIAGANAAVAAAVGKRVAALQIALAGSEHAAQRVRYPDRGAGEVSVGPRGAFRAGHQSFLRVCDVAQVATGVGDSIHAGQVRGIHQGCGEGETMKPLLLIFVLALTAAGQESRREITNAAANPADDKKGLSDKVPDVYAMSTQFDRVVVLRFKFDTDLLAGLEKMVKQEKIANADHPLRYGKCARLPGAPGQQSRLPFQEHVRQESHRAGGYRGDERLHRERRPPPAHHAGYSRQVVRRPPGARDECLHFRVRDHRRAQGRCGPESRG